MGSTYKKKLTFCRAKLYVYVVLACDGLWDTVTPEEAVKEYFQLIFVKIYPSFC